MIRVGDIAIVTRLPHAVAVEFGHEDVGKCCHM